MDGVSNSFMLFLQEKQGAAFMESVQKYDAASALDSKTAELAYIAVLAALRLQGGMNFHVKHAKSLGASREEIKSAVLVGLPAAGLQVVEALPLALQAYDE
jgi:alkylhydroperoxidase/carboxymuconolactone decarboxylase family protein YurZ